MALAGNKNALGHKGGGGRKTLKAELDFNELIKNSVEYLVKNFPKFSDKEKLEVSLKVVCRAMPQSTDITTKGGALNISLISYDKTKKDGDANTI